MSSNSNCSFCIKKGIKGPHDHKIRDFSKKGNPITCPELINLTCNYCKGKGHTVAYCKILKEKHIHKEEPTISSNKRNILNNHSQEVKESISNKLQKTNILTSMFDALDVEETDFDKPITKSWANITSLNRPPHKNIIVDNTFTSEDKKTNQEKSNQYYDEDYDEDYDENEDKDEDDIGSG